MDEISTVSCPSLTEQQVNALHDVGIIKLLDFFMAHPQYIRQITAMNLMSFEELRHEILQFLRPIPIYMNETISQLGSTAIATGIDKLDELIGGGLLPGEVLEFYGKPGSGKTQLSINACINLSQEATVAYFDTKNGVSKRTLQAYSKCGEKRLKNFRLFKGTSLNEVSNKLSDFHLETMLGQNDLCHRLKAVIIDSLPMLIYPAVSDDREAWRFHLEKINEHINQLRKCGVIIILVNHEVTKYKNWNDKGGQTNTPTALQPALGKYWGHIPNFRVVLSKSGLPYDDFIKGHIVKASRNGDDA